MLNYRNVERKTLRAYFVITFVFLFLIFSRGAQAKVELKNGFELKNREIIQVMKEAGYAGYKFFQPNDFDEYERDTLQKVNVSGFPYFPLIAVKEEKATLIMLKKIEGRWEIQTENSTALNREPLTLNEFSVRIDDEKIDVLFNFLDKMNELKSTLCMNINKRTGGGFKSLIVQPGKSSIYQFADIWSVEFNGGYTITYEYISPFIRNSYKVYKITYESDGDIDNFDLTKVPFSIYELMKKTVVRSDLKINDGKIYARSFPWNESKELFELEEGEEILTEDFDGGMEHREWILAVVDEVLCFINKGNISK